MVATFQNGGGQRRQPRQFHRSITPGVMLVCLLWHTSITKGLELERFEFHEPHLGTIVDLTLYASDETVANQSARAAYSRIEELNRILSDYNPDSEVMRLCRTAGTGQAVKVSPELYEVLARSIEYAKATDGAFDISIGPVVRLWRTARRLKKVPAREELAEAMALVDWKQIILDPVSRTVELRKPGMLLDFGGIAKGYIADQARAVLVSKGAARCLVAVAGDIAVGDSPPGRSGWRIGIAPLDRPDGDPSRYLLLTNCSVSTAGDAFQFVEIGGVRYSHIVDPTTGLGLTRRISVTVVAPQGISADGLDTAISIVGPDRGLKLIEQSQGAAALIVTENEEHALTVFESPSLAKFLAPKEEPAQ